MTVRIWGNPRTISNVNCLFSMHNWVKWVNLSKMAGFNISLSLNERQSSSNKKHNKSLHLVLFISFCCCFAGSLPFSLSTMKQTKLFHSISEMFFTFLTRKTLYADTLKVSSGALIEVTLLFRYSTTDREATRVLALFGHLSEWQFNWL